MMTRTTALSGLLVVVLVSHLALGSIAFFASEGSVSEWAGKAYGAKLEMNPESRHIVRILGAFMLAIAALTAIALKDPSARRPIVSGIVVLLLLRVGQRVAYAEEIQSVFGISPTRIWIQAGLFAAVACALWLLRPAASDPVARR